PNSCYHFCIKECTLSIHSPRLWADVFSRYRHGNYTSLVCYCHRDDLHVQCRSGQCICPVSFPAVQVRCSNKSPVESASYIKRCYSFVLFSCSRPRSLREGRLNP